MIRVAHETAIAAPVDHICSIAMDIEHWPDWLPTVSAAQKLSQGPFDCGSRFELKQPFQPAAIWEVTQAARHSFTWRRLSGGLLRLQARHEVFHLGSLPVSRIGLTCSGPLSILLWPVLRVVFALTLRVENAALKRRCQSNRIRAKVATVGAAQSTQPQSHDYDI